MTTSTKLCRQCQQPIVGRPGQARFCCDDCREKWYGNRRNPSAGLPGEQRFKQDTQKGWGTKCREGEHRQCRDDGCACPCAFHHPEYAGQPELAYPSGEAARTASAS